MTEPPKLAADSPLPQHQLLRDRLLGQLMTSVWLPGQALPATERLAEQHGVTCDVVHRAVDILVTEGWLERRPGEGVFVRRADFRSSFFRFFRIRDQEGQAPMPSSRVIGRRQCRASAEVAKRLGVPVEAPVILLRRLRLIGETPVLIEEIWLQERRFARLLEIPVASYGDLLYPLYERECGVIIAQASEDLMVENASATVAEALKIHPGDAVVVIERLARGLDGAVLEWRRSRGVGSRFRYRVDIF